MWSRPQTERPRTRTGRRDGFILLEVLLALMVFSIAVVGLTDALSSSIDITNALQRDHTVRLGLDAILTEARAREDIGEMELERVESALGVIFTTTIEEVGDLQNRENKRLRDMYILRATATFQDGSDEPETVETYLYKP